MRNEMIDLLDDAMFDWDDVISECQENGEVPPDSFEEHIADHLLSNGVTIISSCEGCLFSNRKRPQKCSCCRRNKDMADLFTPKSNARHWSDYPPKED